MGFFSNLIGDLTFGLVGDSSEERAAKEAQERSQEATDQSAALQREMFGSMRSDLAPYRNIGSNAIQKYYNQYAQSPEVPTFDPSQIENDPSYQFRLKQGLEAVNRGAAGNRMLNSGNRMLALNEFGQGMASNEMQNAFNRIMTQYGLRADRQNTIMNRLGNLGTMGQNAAAMTGTAGMNTASNIGNLLNQNAVNQTAAYMYKAQNSPVNKMIDIGTSIVPFM